MNKRAEVHERVQHSIVQELIDAGAYDVAKSYIDFLKQNSHRSPDLIGDISVSPVGKKSAKKNNMGADFGSDMKGTKTSSLQEALVEAAKKQMAMKDALGFKDESDAK
jgi:hypothetical protein